MSNTEKARVAGTIEVSNHIAASEVKQRGWRGVMRTVRQQGAVVVTNHSEPEAVILGIEQYEALLQAARMVDARKEADLDALRRRFDERLAVLRPDDAGDRLRAVLRKPARLDGKVRSGASF
jgi:prevent-host-death family protein